MNFLERKTTRESTALVSFFYKGCESFIPDFIKSVNKQSYNKFKVIIFNDNLENLYALLGELALDYDVIQLHSKSIAEKRIEGLTILTKMNFNNFVFQDADDLMSENRMHDAIKNLREYNIVVHDLDIYKDGNLLSQKIWSERFNSPIFTRRDLDKFNFAGLGNTSITKFLLAYLPLSVTANVLAVDWLIFHSLIIQANCRGFFSSEATVYYRQHSQNEIGIDKIDVEKRKNEFNEHWSFLKRYDYSLQVNTENINIRNKTKIDHLFWWEH